ncbi:unnamed protein product [Linum trigynum]|uniref:Reverse transcriptase zinc-binding domain-containing protein n=1 Tax=Linum trigynum TaxID=586398 RepID=A0AAV2FTK5_9ROSI
MVAEVIEPAGGQWSDQKLSQWFDPPTCAAIKAIPLPRLPVADRLVWHNTPEGIFTVKSAYHLAVTLDRRQGCWRSEVSWMDKASWVRVWGANLPPKLKVFVWQILNRLLPTTEALIAKGVPVLPRCPVCWAESETLEHLFLFCPVARALWDYSGLASLGEGLPQHTFPLFLKWLMALLTQPPVLMSVVAILWRIWRSRNWVVFEGKQFGFPGLLRQYNQQYEEWVGLPVDRHPRSAVAPISQPVLAGGDRMVCMWDGATRRGSHAAGGFVLLTPNREVLMAGGVQFPGIDDPKVIEALALREAILWCQNQRLREVCFEGDAKVVIDKINQADASDSRIGAILAEIIHLLMVRPGFDVRFVGRGNNRVAHLVARKALSLYPTTSRSFDFQAWLFSRL